MPGCWQLYRSFGDGRWAVRLGGWCNVNFCGAGLPNPALGEPAPEDPRWSQVAKAEYERLMAEEGLAGIVVDGTTRLEEVMGW